MTAEKRKVIMFVDREYNDLELWYPFYRLQEEGIQVDVVGVKKGITFKGQAGLPIEADYSYEEIDPEDYVGLIIPGGWAPDRIRRFPEALAIIQKMNDANKPIGQICHAGWALVSANIIRDRKVTSYYAIKDDMKNAGGEWIDEGTVVDSNLVSSQSPQDLPQFVKAFIDLLEE